MTPSEWAADANRTALQRPPPDIELKFNIFHHFDRPILIQCVETMLEGKKSRDMMIGMIKTATITTFPWLLTNPSDERWLNASLLKSYHSSEEGGGGVGPNSLTNFNPSDPFSVPFSDDIVQFDPRRAPAAAGEVLDLYQLYNLMPSAEGDYSLALLDYSWQLVLGVIYSLTAFTSFFLNLITVIVLKRSPKCELRRYLINLSVSDLLMSCFSIPVTYTELMLGSWILPDFLCPLGRFVVTLGVFVSTATMMVIGINRHSAIMYPLKPKKPTKIRHWRVRQIHVIMGIWLLGIAISSPEWMMVQTAPFCFNQKLYFECRTIWPEFIANSYTIFIFLSTFMVPLSLLSSIYIRLAFRMWNHERPGNKSANQSHSMQEQRIKVFKMLLVVVIVFVISWLPIQIYSLVNLFYPDLRKTEYQSVNWNIAIAAYFTSHWLSMAHSCINPLIYGFMSKKFRRDLKKRLFWARWPVWLGGGGPDTDQANNPTSNGLSSKTYGGVTSEERANFQRSLMSRKSCRSPNDFEQKPTILANGPTTTAAAADSPDPLDLAVESKTEAIARGDDELEPSDQLADGPEAANGHDLAASSRQFVSTLQKQQQQHSSRRSSDGTFAIVEFHKQKYTTRPVRSNSDEQRTHRADAEPRPRRPIDSNNINWPTCAPGDRPPGARLSCCVGTESALAVVPTLHEEDELEEEEEEEEEEGEGEGEGEAAEELADGNCALAFDNGQDVESCFGAIKQQQQRRRCERKLVVREQSNGSSRRIKRSVIIVSSPSASSSLSHVANV